MKSIEKPFYPGEHKEHGDLPEENKRDYKAIDESGSYVRKSAIESPDEAAEEAEKVVLAEVLNLNYEAGHFEPAVVNRNTYGEPRGPVHERPRVWGAKCELEVKLEDGQIINIWIRDDMRLALGVKRFSGDLIEFMRATIPQTVQIEYRGNRKCIATDDLIAWADKIKKFPYERQEEAKERGREDAARKIVMQSWQSYTDLQKLAQNRGFSTGAFVKKLVDISERNPEWIGRVQKGERLVSVYAPEFFKEMDDFITARKKRSR